MKFSKSELDIIYQYAAPTKAVVFQIKRAFDLQIIFF